jgi:uncharacterized protein (DUF58 family)
MRWIPSEDKVREILKTVRAIEIRTRAALDSTLCGAYHSVFRGQGLNFDEIREYCDGDDVRSIDWNVTAKMGKPFVKIFREERELTVLIMVDVSGSGKTGSTGKTKRELAGELACVLAFSAMRNNDKVGLLLFSDGLEKFVRPQRGSQHLLRMVRDILFFHPRSQKTNVAEALKSLRCLQRRKAIVCLISDFLENTPDSLWHALPVIKKRYDLMAAVVSDPREQTIPSLGYVCLEDAETGRKQWIHTDTVREAFERENMTRLEDLRTRFRRMGIDCLEITPGCSYVHLLQQFFKARMRWKR